MSYKETQQYKLSPKFAVAHYRSFGDEQIDTLDEFLAWLEFDDDAPIMSKEEFNDVVRLVDLYLGRDEKKVEQGEKEMLDQWIEAQKPG